MRKKSIVNVCAGLTETNSVRVWFWLTLVADAYPLICPFVSSATGPEKAHSLEPARAFSVTMGLLTAATVALRPIATAAGVWAAIASAGAGAAAVATRHNATVIATCLNTLRGSIATEHDRHGAHQDREVHPQRGIRDIAQIESIHLAQAETAAAADLPQTGDAWLYDQAAMHPVRSEERRV